MERRRQPRPALRTVLRIVLWTVLSIGLTLGFINTMKPRLAAANGDQPALRLDALELEENDTAAPGNPGATVFYTETLMIPTYPYEAYLSEVYDAELNLTYPVLDWIAYERANPQPVPRKYVQLVLENDYLKVTLLPELGGRIYRLIDKSTGRDQLYQNPVIKPAHMGSSKQGWWLDAGGIEWALPVGEHGYAWGIPWNWEVSERPDGIAVTVSDTQATDRLQAQIRIFLPSDRAYMQITPRIENPTARTLAYTFWANAAVALGGAAEPSAGTEFRFNARWVTLHTTRDSRFPEAWPNAPTGPDYRFTWPVYEGVDYSRLSEWEQTLGFFEYPRASRGFAGVYDRSIEKGLVRVFPRYQVPGLMGYGWAPPKPGQPGSGLPSRRVELRGGVAPTLWDTAYLGPWRTKTWTEVWYPFGALGDISEATEEAVLHVYQETNTIGVDLQTTGAHAEGEAALTVIDRESCELLAQWPLPALVPGTVYRNHVYMSDRSLYDVTVFYGTGDDEILASFGPTECTLNAEPAPHLGYGINLRKLENLEPLVDPLGIDWVKLWDEYSKLPEEPLEDYRVLYNVSGGGYVRDLNRWRDHIASIAEEGKGKVDAYEISNEPNISNKAWGHNEVDPVRFTEMLCVAAEEIKAVDPDALVISGGLAPVGRIDCPPDKRCEVMDEQLFLRRMLDAGAGACIDGFGYHPYGFAHPPEQDPDPILNGFTFRSTEAMREILVERDRSDIPIWATEFNWIRSPSEDGVELECGDHRDYAPYFAWQEVTPETQADYLVRAYEYADENWPWMAGLFVWNVDWHDYRTQFDCFHPRYYALRVQNGDPLGEATPAYEALAEMRKRIVKPEPPEFEISPERKVLWTDLRDPRVITSTLTINRAEDEPLTWSATLSSSSHRFTPILQGIGSQSQYRPGTLSVRIDSHGLDPGTYTATLQVREYPTSTVQTPQSAQVILKVLNQPGTLRWR